MDNPIQVDLGRIAQDLQIRRVQVESVVQLLDEGNTVPFITRYRKERTGNLNEIAIREIQLRVGRLRELAERKETILKAIEAQGKLSEELAAAIRAADNPKRLEDLYLPFKPKKKTKASDARERGLEPLALRIWNHDETLTDLQAAAAEFVNAEKEVETVDKVLEGVGHILAEAINELAVVRDGVRRVVWKTGKVSTTKSEIPEGEGLEYRDYFDYSEPIAQIPPHRVLAINRGDKEGPLKVKLDVSRADLESATFAQLPLDGHPQADFFRSAALDALDRLLMPSMEREVRRDLTEMAERHAVDVFARNLRSLLLQPPIPKQVVLAIDPGFRNGCKVAVLGEHGELLDHGVIHPHPPQNRRHESKQFLKDLVGKHKVGVVAIGNGTACRETEELIAEIIAEGTHFHNNPDAAPPVFEPAATEVPAGVVESAETPSAETPATETSEAPASSTNGDGATEAPKPADEANQPEPTEAMPPISGGSPEADEEPTPPALTSADLTPPDSATDASPPAMAESGPVGETTEASNLPADGIRDVIPVMASSEPSAESAPAEAPATEAASTPESTPPADGIHDVLPESATPGTTPPADGVKDVLPAATKTKPPPSGPKSGGATRWKRGGRQPPSVQAQGTAPTASRPHPADAQTRPARLRDRQRGGGQRLLGQPGRSRGVPPTSTTRSGARSRSAAGSKILCPSWSRSSPRISALACISTTSTRSSSRSHSKGSSPVASTSSAST